jgi:hypothetical protein
MASLAYRGSQWNFFEKICEVLPILIEGLTIMFSYGTVYPESRVKAFQLLLEDLDPTGS